MTWKRSPFFAGDLRLISGIDVIVKCKDLEFEVGGGVENPLQDRKFPSLLHIFSVTFPGKLSYPFFLNPQEIDSCSWETTFSIIDWERVRKRVTLSREKSFGQSWMGRVENFIIVVKLTTFLRRNNFLEDPFSGNWWESDDDRKSNEREWRKSVESWSKVKARMREKKKKKKTSRLYNY